MGSLESINQEGLNKPDWSRRITRRVSDPRARNQDGLKQLNNPAKVEQEVLWAIAAWGPKTLSFLF